MGNEMQIGQKRQPTFFIALLPILSMLVIIGVGYSLWKLPLTVVLLLSGVAVALVAKYLGYTWSEMQGSIAEKISQSTGAILILLSVGMMIGAWMASGTLPMMIYYGIQIINPKFLYVTAFLSTAIVSVLTGTSYGAVGTMGIVVMSIASTLGLSMPIAAGAALSGAYFGDKLTPLSDTTILASTVTNVDIYQHIKHMLWTTIPATLLGLAVYFLVGLRSQGGDVTSELVSNMMAQLDMIYNWNILLLLPMLIVLIGSFLHYPTVPVMFLSSVVACVLAMTVQDFTFKNVLTACANGFNVNMVVREGFDAKIIISEVTRLINRGGMSSMMGMILILYCAYIYGGIISLTGCLDTILQKLLTKVTTTAGLITSTVVSCLLMSLIGGTSYLSIIIPGELFQNAYKAKGLDLRNLSRTLEDSGTVVVPLIPWASAGVYMSATLGVPTLEYLPWAIMNYTGFMFAIFYACTGISIKKAGVDNR
ncbi:Na+/H+ antiporter NhaC [Synergistaceae bacterium OttesenSCG-928-D05]|nr:Na+/H+ antiporter NhaC [Synergistaceae bacterium OttesenSCG-928-D05]